MTDTIHHMLDHLDGLNIKIAEALGRDDMEVALTLDQQRQNSINQIDTTSAPLSPEIKHRLEIILKSITSDIKHLENSIKTLNKETSQTFRRYKGYR
ncbi:MAG: hypothetical protein ACO3TT_07615 [Candidatus Puniceispirillales bacterium]